MCSKLKKKKSSSYREMWKKVSKTYLQDLQRLSQCIDSIINFLKISITMQLWQMAFQSTNDQENTFDTINLNKRRYQIEFTLYEEIEEKHKVSQELTKV